MNLKEQLERGQYLRARDKRTRKILPPNAIIAVNNGKWQFTKIGAGRFRNQLNAQFPTADYQTFCSPEHNFAYVVACVVNGGVK